LYVLASFANHFDIKDHNSMDVYVGKNGEGYLEHYLLDFGSTFGSAGHGPMRPIMGYANLMDVRDMAVSILTSGLKEWQWEDAPAPTNPSVGYYESDIFHPAKWDPVYPIPPFENMTDQDGYWGAKKLLAFRDEHLQALVKTGQYHDPAAEAYLLKTMIERRDKIGRHWFGKINPLDYPSLTLTPDSMILAFHDLAVEYGLTPGDVTYEYTLRGDGRELIAPIQINATRVPLGNDQLQALPALRSNSYELRIRTRRDNNDWSKPVVFWLYRDPAGKQFSIIGIEHPG